MHKAVFGSLDSQRNPANLFPFKSDLVPVKIAADIGDIGSQHLRNFVEGSQARPKDSVNLERIPIPDCGAWNSPHPFVAVHQDN